MVYREYLLEILHGKVDLLGIAESEKRDAEVLGESFGIKAWWLDPKGLSKRQKRGRGKAAPDTEELGSWNEMKTEVVMLPEKSVKATPIERVNRWVKVVGEILDQFGSPRGIKVTLGPRERLMITSIQKEMDRQAVGETKGAVLHVDPATEVVDGKQQFVPRAFILSAEVPPAEPEHHPSGKHAAD